jgi:hypothetical protein
MQQEGRADPRGYRRGAEQDCRYGGNRDRLHRQRPLDGAICGGTSRRVVLAECDTYRKSTRIKREVVVWDC